MEQLRIEPCLSCFLLTLALLSSPALGQGALVAEGMITPTDATTASEIVAVQMRTATEVPGPPFVVSLDPPRLALSSQASHPLASHVEPFTQSLGKLAAGAWQVSSYGVDWGEPGSEPRFEGFSGPATFHVTAGEVHPKRLHPIAGEPFALRVVGRGDASCVPQIDSVSIEGQPPRVVIRARRPDCQSVEEQGALFKVDVPAPSLAAGQYRVEVQVPKLGEEGVEVYATASFRVVPPGEPRILDLKVEHDPERNAHSLVAVVKTCSSWTVSPRNAWAHGRDLYALFESEPTAAACGDAVNATHRFPLPHLETGLYRILAHRQLPEGISEFWAQSKTLVDVQKLAQLIDGRYRLTVTWRDYRGRTGRGVPVAHRGEGEETESAIFYFFSEDNWELLVKVLDGCALNNHHWVFASASTDVEYTLRVEDLVSGARATYRNELGEASPAITDTAALAACE